MKFDVVSDSIDKISEAAIADSATQLVPEGSILVVVRSGILARTVPTAITGRSLTINQDLKAICPTKKLDPQFLAHFMRASETRLLATVTRGATVHRLTTDTLKALQIPLPPLEEQKRIVAVLDRAFAALDRARGLAEANLADAGELFGSWLQSASAFGSQQWPTKALPEISENLDRARVPITKKDRQPGDVPYYGASGVVDYVAEHIFDDNLLLISEDGANLLARTYPIAFSITGKSWVNNHAHVLKFDDLDSQEFVRLYLNAISLAPYVSGMAQPKLNQQMLNRIPIPFPNLADRRRIVAKAATMWERSEMIAKNYKAQLSDTADLRQTLLQKAFAGELI